MSSTEFITHSCTSAEKDRPSLATLIFAFLFTIRLHCVHTIAVPSTFQQQQNETLDSGLPTAANPLHLTWIEAAFQFLHGLKCRDVLFTSERECRGLVRLDDRTASVYLAPPSPHGRYTAVLPDGGLLMSGDHDVVIVIDPHPHANFGHLVVVFYVEFGVDETRCRREEGHYLGDSECLVLGFKRRCKNALQRRRRRRNFARRCEINFLPLVHLASDVTNKTQQLSCVHDSFGFAPCPEPRQQNETAELICSPLRDNTKRCETTHASLRPSCRVFEICDHAVIVSGGWNGWSTRPHHRTNIQRVVHTLRNHGFRGHNIKVFFANGVQGILPADDDVPGADDADYSAGMKRAMRYHLQRLCAAPHCVDSLLVYMNSPSTADGTSLLWDVDGDGQASELETYTTRELLADLSLCKARQVHVVADQSYSGELVRAFRRSKLHRNVAVFTSSRDTEYSYGADFTRAWTRTNHTQTCMRDVHREAKKSVRHSTPESWAGEAAANVNVFGAPCDIIPPFTHHELRQNYLGCQNLPSAIWMKRFSRQSRARSEARSSSQVTKPTELNEARLRRSADKE